MKNLLIAICCVLIFGCVNDKKPHEKIKYKYFFNSRKINHKADSMDPAVVNFIDPKDLLLAEDRFNFNEQEHIVKAYTSDNHAAMDGGSLYYTLDSIGVIYSKSTTWRSFVRLETNNDSINNLINVHMVLY